MRQRPQSDRTHGSRRLTGSSAPQGSSTHKWRKLRSPVIPPAVSGAVAPQRSSICASCMPWVSAKATVGARRRESPLSTKSRLLYSCDERSTYVENTVSEPMSALNDLPSVSIERQNCIGDSESFRLSVINTPYDGVLDRSVRSELCELVQSQWASKWDRTPGRDPDRDWDWEGDVFGASCFPLGTVDPADGTLVVLLSGDGARLEGISRIVHKCRTFHLPLGSGRVGRVATRPKAAYIDSLAVAPWNRSDIPPPPRVRQLGGVLLGASILASAEAGTNGRIALHAASTATSWYEEQLVGAIFSNDRRELRDLVHGGDDPAPGGPYIECGEQVAVGYISRNAEALTALRTIFSGWMVDSLFAKCDALSEIGM